MKRNVLAILAVAAWVTVCDLLMFALGHDSDVVNQLVGVTSTWIALRMRTSCA